MDKEKYLSESLVSCLGFGHYLGQKTEIEFLSECLENLKLRYHWCVWFDEEKVKALKELKKEDLPKNYPVEVVAYCLHCHKTIKVIIEIDLSLYRHSFWNIPDRVYSCLISEGMICPHCEEVLSYKNSFNLRRRRERPVLQCGDESARTFNFNKKLSFFTPLIKPNRV